MDLELSKKRYLNIICGYNKEQVKKVPGSLNTGKPSSLGGQPRYSLFNLFIIKNLYKKSIQYSKY